MRSIGIDIGGTKIAGALVEHDGSVVREVRRSTPAGHARSIEDAVVEMTRELSLAQTIPGVGVAAAGIFDASQSTVLFAPNIEWRNEPIRSNLESRLGMHVLVENDANAAGWAEFRYGAGRCVTDMVALTIGTGVGGAIVADGRLLRGAFGAGGELGHIRVVPDGIQCGCGARGCLEQYGSGRALLRFANDLADEGGIGRPLADRRRASGRLNGHDLKELLAIDDPGALVAIGQIGSWIGQACASLAAILDPRLFVFGGGVAQTGEKLLGPVRRAFFDCLPARGFRPEPQFRIAEFVDTAGVIGAADLVRRQALST